MGNRIKRLLARLTSNARSTARKTWSELLGHLTVGIIIEAIVSGDPAWIIAALFLLVMTALLRR